MPKCSFILLFAFAFLAPQLHAQSIAETRPLVQRASAEHESIVSGGAGELHARMQQELIARTVVERQLQLRLDTEKLLALAAELKQHVDKTNPNVLSLDVIKKAQEIEKLAKSVREKMRDAY